MRPVSHRDNAPEPGAGGRPAARAVTPAPGGLDDAILRRRFFAAGVVILVAGLAAAVLAYRAAVPDADSVLVARLNNTKSYEYQMEVVGGRANILATELKEWFLGLWHGKPLAHTLAFLSVASALACFFVAHRLGVVARRRSKLGVRAAAGGR